MASQPINPFEKIQIWSTLYVLSREEKLRLYTILEEFYTEVIFRDWVEWQREDWYKAFIREQMERDMSYMTEMEGERERAKKQCEEAILECELYSIFLSNLRKISAIRKETKLEMNGSEKVKESTIQGWEDHFIYAIFMEMDTLGRAKERAYHRIGLYQEQLFFKYEEAMKKKVLQRLEGPLLSPSRELSSFGYDVIICDHIPIE